MGSMNPALSTFLKYVHVLIPLPNLNPNLIYSTYFELYLEVRAGALNYSTYFELQLTLIMAFRPSPILMNRG